MCVCVCVCVCVCAYGCGVMWCAGSDHSFDWKPSIGLLVGVRVYNYCTCMVEPKIKVFCSAMVYGMPTNVTAIC